MAIGSIIAQLAACGVSSAEDKDPRWEERPSIKHL